MVEQTLGGNKGVLGKSIQGGKWAFYSNLTQKALSVVTFFILVRLLLPEHYGILAVIFLITDFFSSISSHGLEYTLTQRKGDIEQYIDTVWTINVVKGFVAALIIYYLAPWVSVFFHVPKFVSVIRWSGLLIIVPMLGNVRMLYAFRDMNFKKIFFRDFNGQLAHTIVSLVWAIGISASVWALFFGQIARLVASEITAYVIYPGLPRPALRVRQLFPLFNYSKWITAKSIIEYILGMLDRLYVGRLLDVISLGLYAKAKDLSSVVTSPVIHILSKVGFPSYAKLQDKTPKIKEGLVKSIDVVTLAAVPFSLVLLLEGGGLVSVLLGRAWLGVVPPLKILSVAFIVHSLVIVAGVIFDGIGRPRISFISSSLQLIFSLVLIYVGTKYYGMVGASWGYLGAITVVLLYVGWKIVRVLNLKKSDIFPTFLCGSVAVFTTLMSDIVFRIYTRNIVGSITTLIWSGCLLLIYLGVVWLLSGHLKTGPRYTLLTIINELRGDLLL